MADDELFDETRRGGRRIQGADGQQETAKALEGGARPIRFGRVAQFAAQAEDAGEDLEGGRGALCQKVAGKRTKRHGDQKDGQAQGGPHEIDEGEFLEAFESLQGVRVDGGGRAEEGRGQNHQPERTFGDADLPEEDRQEQTRNPQRHHKEDARRPENAAQKGFEPSEFLLGRENGDFTGENEGEDGDGQGQEGGELRQGLNRTEFGGRDARGDEPQADEGVQGVRRAAGAEKHKRIPPEIAEFRVNSMKYGGSLLHVAGYQRS